MAEEHPPSLRLEDELFVLGRLRVKPAMRTTGKAFRSKDSALFQQFL